MCHRVLSKQTENTISLLSAMYSGTNGDTKSKSITVVFFYRKRVVTVKGFYTRHYPKSGGRWVTPVDGSADYCSPCTFDMSGKR